MTPESFILLIIFGSIAIISACNKEIEPEKKNTTKKNTTKKNTTKKEEFQQKDEEFEQVSEEDYSLPSYSEVTKV
jgi:hypothetical protein